MASQKFTKHNLSSIAHQLLEKYSDPSSLNQFSPKHFTPESLSDRSTVATHNHTLRIDRKVIDLIDDAAVYSDSDDISRIKARLFEVIDDIDTMTDKSIIEPSAQMALLEEIIQLLTKAREKKKLSVQKKQDNLASIMAKIERLANPIATVNQERQKALQSKLQILENHLTHAKNQVEEYKINCCRLKSMVKAQPQLVTKSIIGSWLAMESLKKSQATFSSSHPSDLRIIPEIDPESSPDHQSQLTGILRLEQNSAASIPGLPTRSVIHSYLNSNPMIARHIRTSGCLSRQSVALKLLDNLGALN